MNVMIGISLIFTILMGSALFLYMSVILYEKIFEKILGLFRIKRTLVSWHRNKGKCKECRRNDVYTPKIYGDKMRF